MAIDPFARGPHPVGVRTVELRDAARDRTLPTEIWYPAAEQHRGADLDPATRDHYPFLPGFPEAWQAAVRDAKPAGGGRLAIFSHGFGGHRRQSTFFTTHLASHGFVVLACDHVGNTFRDLIPVAPPDAWPSSEAARPRDISFLIDRAKDFDADASEVAMTGHSFGGWTSFRAAADDARIASVVALAPAVRIPYVAVPPPSRAAALIIAAEKDCLLPVGNIEGFARERGTRFASIANIDHQHFCDGARTIHELFRSMPFQLVVTTTPMVPFDQLAPARHGHDAARGLGLAHLLGLPDPTDALAARGVVARVSW